MKHTGIYVRVSSKSQCFESQMPDLERWANASGQEVTWYKDTFTGRTMNRPAWQRLYHNVISGRIDNVVVHRLDRLGRTVSGLSQLFAELQQHGVGLISLRDGFDLDTASGRLMANVLASISEFETEVRKCRVASGIKAAKASGKKWGGSKAGRRLWVSKEQIALICEMRGQPISTISRTVGLSRPTIYRILSQNSDLAATCEVVS